MTCSNERRLAGATAQDPKHKPRSTGGTPDRSREGTSTSKATKKARSIAKSSIARRPQRPQTGNREEKSGEARVGRYSQVQHEGERARAGRPNADRTRPRAAAPLL